MCSVKLLPHPAPQNLQSTLPPSPMCCEARFIPQIRPSTKSCLVITCIVKRTGLQWEEGGSWHLTDLRSNPGLTTYHCSELCLLTKLRFSHTHWRNENHAGIVVTGHPVSEAAVFMSLQRDAKSGSPAYNRLSASFWNCNTPCTYFFSAVTVDESTRIQNVSKPFS